MGRKWVRESARFWKLVIRGGLLRPDLCAREPRWSSTNETIRPLSLEVENIHTRRLDTRLIFPVWLYKYGRGRFTIQAVTPVWILEVSPQAGIPCPRVLKTRQRKLVPWLNFK